MIDIPSFQAGDRVRIRVSGECPKDHKPCEDGLTAVVFDLLEEGYDDVEHGHIYWVRFDPQPACRHKFAFCSWNELEPLAASGGRANDVPEKRTGE